MLPSRLQDWLGLLSRIGSYRGTTDAGGLLAQAYEHQGNLHDALTTIDAAINANIKIPDELYLVPRTLAVKAEITARLGTQLKPTSSIKKYRAREWVAARRADRQNPGAAAWGNERHLLRILCITLFRQAL